MMWKQSLPAFLGALIASSGSLAAQQPGRTFRPQASGWIGVRVECTVPDVMGRDQTVAVIQEVMKGSPAEAAGILVGDTLTHVDGEAMSLRLCATLSADVHAGDLVRLHLRREGDRDLLLEAGQRPHDLMPPVPDAREMVIRLDTLRGAILKSLDSLRVSIARVDPDSTGWGLGLRVSANADTTLAQRMPDRVFQFWTDTLMAEPGGIVIPPDLGVPFEAYLIASPATDSLQSQLVSLRRDLQELRRQEDARRRELEASRQGAIEEILRADRVIRELRARETDILAEREELSARLRQVSEEQLQRQQWAQEEAARDRSLSPLIVGQNTILGAQLETLNPDLAAYFSVEEGVVVLRVIDDTPASDVGLQGGDVIVRIGSEPVTTLADLRLGLTVARGAIPLQIVRKGQTIRLIIPRGD